MILQTLYQQCIKNKVKFFDEFQVVDLLVVNGAAAGVVAIELLTGEIACLSCQVGSICHRRARARVGYHLQRLRLHR